MRGKGKQNKWIGGQTGFFLLFFHELITQRPSSGVDDDDDDDDEGRMNIFYSLFCC